MSDELLNQEEIDAMTAAASEVNTGAAEADAAATGVPAAAQSDAVVRPVEFAPMSSQQGHGVRNGVELILDVQLHVAVELGHTTMKVKDVLGLVPGSVVELDKHAGEPVEVVVNNKTIARGEVVVIDENFGVRITEIVNRNERPGYAKAA